MSWDNHINYIVPKLARVVAIVNHYRSVLPTSVKLLLYKSLFYSHLTYCLLVWGTSTMTNIEKLFLLQKKILRGICNVPYNFHSADLFKICKIINIYKLYQYRLATSFKSEKIRGLCFLERLASLREISPHYSTRNTEKWRMVTQRTNYGYQMLNFTLPHLLNSLCTDNIDFDSFTFKDLRLYFCTWFLFSVYVLHLGEPWFVEMSTVELQRFHCILCLVFCFFFFSMLAADQCKGPEDQSSCLLQLFSFGPPIIWWK